MSGEALVDPPHAALGLDRAWLTRCQLLQAFRKWQIAPPTRRFFITPKLAVQ